MRKWGCAAPARSFPDARCGIRKALEAVADALACDWGGGIVEGCVTGCCRILALCSSEGRLSFGCAVSCFVSWDMVSEMRRVQYARDKAKHTCNQARKSDIKSYV